MYLFLSDELGIAITQTICIIVSLLFLLLCLVVICLSIVKTTISKHKTDLEVFNQKLEASKFVKSTRKYRKHKKEVK